MKIRSRAVNYLIAICATLLLRLVFLTVRFDHRFVYPDGTPYLPAAGKTRFTFCLWHDSIVMAIFGRKTWQLSGLISQHTDGGYLADAAKLSNILPVRGSTTRGGAGAVRRLLELPDWHLAITPDGPQGPRRKLKTGVAFLSSRAGRPVVPTSLVVNRCWRLTGRWTDLVIPKPFARIVAIAGVPVSIPAEAERESLDGYLELIDAEMHRLEFLATRILNGDKSAAEWIDRVGQIPEDAGELREHSRSDPPAGMAA